MPNGLSPADRSDYWRVAIVEDHLLQRLRTQELLDAQPGMRVVHGCESLPELMSWLAATDARTRPHLVILDLVVERGPSVDPAQVQRLVAAGIRVLVLSAFASPALVREVLKCGVAGVVGKRDPEEDIVAAAWAALQRRRWVTPELAAVMVGDPDRPSLSDQEERALILYASGLKLDDVAVSLGVKPGTAKKYLERVKDKYAAAGRPARTKIELYREATRDGLLDDGTNR